MDKRSFNIIGTCKPDTDYMVDISERVKIMKEMVDRGNYFTINRPRQFGKTTLISALTDRLSDEYICARISFEGFGDECFDNATAFCLTVTKRISRALENSRAGYDIEYVRQWENASMTNFTHLDEHISKMCKGRKVVLLIDEVDKTSNNKVFIHFLGVLRNKFLLRKDGLDHTFHSVVLASVHDIRNLKLKLINENDTSSTIHGHPLNSPWNIAVPFLVDMAFNPKDISGMLTEYEKDYATNMEIAKVSEAIYEYTSGYPFLVSQICKMLDESLPLDWTVSGVHNAVKALINQVHTVYGVSTLFDDISKNLESNPDIYAFVYDVLIVGKQMHYTLSDPTIQRAAMYGIINSKDSIATISNRIFEIYITDYFTSKDRRNQNRSPITGYKGDIVKCGRFDMESCLTKFSELFQEIYSDRDQTFIEEHGRMLFLTYLKPLINGGGFYHIESQLTDQRRMDLVVDYGREQFIIELKLWYGESAHEKAFDQLSGYLKSKGLLEGYLLTFDFRKEKNRTAKAQWVEYKGMRIFDVVM